MHKRAAVHGVGLVVVGAFLGFAAATVDLSGTVAAAPSSPASLAATASGVQAEKKPNILVIFGDDIGQTNISAYSMGLMGYHTPNIDRIAREGMIFTD